MLQKTFKTTKNLHNTPQEDFFGPRRYAELHDAVATSVGWKFLENMETPVV